VDEVPKNLALAESRRESDSDYETVWRPEIGRVMRILDKCDTDIDAVPEDMAERQALSKLQLAVRPLAGLDGTIRAINEGTKIGRGIGGPRGGAAGGG
jgi:hypothetical protein